MKLLRRIALGIAALVVIAVAVTLFYANTIIRAAIETACTRALGVETHVGWVAVGPLTGSFGLGRLRIDNPPGYETDHFFSLGRIHFEVPPKSLREPTIRVPMLAFEDVDVSLEKVGGKHNYEVILENLRRFSSTGSADPNAEASQKQEGGKRLVIREAVISDVVARIDLGKVKGGADRVEVEIAEIRVQPNRATGQAEVSVAEMTRIVVTAVLTSVAKKAPLEIARGLLAGAVSLKDVGVEVPGLLVDTGASAGGGAKKVGETAGGGAKKLGETAGDAIKGLGGLFGGGGGDDDE